MSIHDTGSSLPTLAPRLLLLLPPFPLTPPAVGSSWVCLCSSPRPRRLRPGTKESFKSVCHMFSVIQRPQPPAGQRGHTVGLSRGYRVIFGLKWPRYKATLVLRGHTVGSSCGYGAQVSVGVRRRKRRQCWRMSEK
ncbi:hypothetical protein Hamer_G019145 [Homarus americanus]|uniref:Uncharacterized protein n=1 Tax=Homarus americanus TaxID=6706 RepID=A0A8J5JHY6_HOMAM|nr:hypothetical protein Hamer_G019145 [Homarus americanus]